MTITAITGSSGFVGKALVTVLRARGHEVRRFVRPSSGSSSDTDTDAIAWDPATGKIDAARCAGIDTVIHLAGENVASGRFTKLRMHNIDNSRGPATQKLCRSLANLPSPPRTLLSASAIGYYGDRGAELLTEQSGSGAGFLADVGRAWEAGTSPLAAAAARIVHLRIGIVLDKHGGALRRMLPAFRLGLGGRLGNGRQYMSFITRTDLLAAICFLLERNDIRGPVNCVSPQPVDNQTFTRSLGKTLHRPAILPIPLFALRLLFGRITDEALLASQRVLPAVLQQHGFSFQHHDIDRALRAALA